MKTDTASPQEKMIFRKTNAHAGRHIAVTPENSTMRHLAYGRIRLNASVPSVAFSNGNRETGLIVLSGAATVSTNRGEFEIGQFDAIYIPRDSNIAESTRKQAAITGIFYNAEVKNPLTGDG